ncbi:serpin family protein [Haloechinothrix sp. LS1_15]|uniref:serpin family protein n=1 Tax=Haloechinothrix sp. LS1_15 TaxID=2652248 RepID=UPI0029460728|nr:serpin family protein [Haloechinothrix sp. LS1_15]MDV6012105.1 serpin family protein [Haloechinothrix sp. LS1_15]
MAERAPGLREHLRFSLALHRQLGGSGNVCVSPYSVASALGMTCQAAGGNTAAQLRGLLCGDEPDIAGHVSLLREASRLSPEGDGEDPVFAVSNALWVWDGLSVHDSFREKLATWPGAKVEKAPFVTEPETARGAINADVARTTRDLIPELIPAGAVDPSTVASLVNALYVKAAWRNRFPERDTREQDFHGLPGKRTVPMMHLVEALPYAEAGGWRSVTLPAAGGVEAVVLLPDGELAEAEPSLDAERLAALLPGPKASRRVAVTLPRLRLGTQTSLVEVLRALGVRDLFTPAADLSGLSDDPRLEVSDVLHESVLELDEQGLEGAAATAVMVRMVAAFTDTPVEFRVDRPFLLLIRHATTGALYFFARVTDPS